MRVAYRERPGTTPVTVEHDVNRLIMGRDQAASVSVTIERADGIGKPIVEFGDFKTDPEFEYAVREGVLASCSRGVLKGFPMMDTLVTVNRMDVEDGTSVGVLAQCAAEAVRRAMALPGVQILHPLMEVEVTVDDTYVCTFWDWISLHA